LANSTAKYVSEGSSFSFYSIEPTADFVFSFTPEMLMEQCPDLGLVVDLTNTSRYYNGQVSCLSLV
jgi:hypothetical protein